MAVLHACWRSILGVHPQLCGPRSPHAMNPAFRIAAPSCPREQAVSLPRQRQCASAAPTTTEGVFPNLHNAGAGIGILFEHLGPNELQSRGSRTTLSRSIQSNSHISVPSYNPSAAAETMPPRYRSTEQPEAMLSYPRGGCRGYRIRVGSDPSGSFVLCTMTLSRATCFSDSR
jgi:hypothetical protein